MKEIEIETLDDGEALRIAKDGDGDVYVRVPSGQWYYLTPEKARRAAEALLTAARKAEKGK